MNPVLRTAARALSGLTLIASLAAVAPAAASAATPAVAPAGTASVAATTTAGVQPLAVTRAIHPRGSYGKADGTVHWGGTVRGSISVRGTLTDYKQHPSNSYLYLSWRALGHRYNKQVAGTSNGHTARFNRTYHFAGAAGSIQLTVCSQYRGKWRCGVPYRV